MIPVMATATEAFPRLAAYFGSDAALLLAIATTQHTVNNATQTRFLRDCKGQTVIYT